MPDAAARHPSPFNSPVESGLRAITLLAAAEPKVCDLGRLVVYDYLLVHSGDVEGGPRSLHPATPHRSGELLVRRLTLQHGLVLMITRELAEICFGDEGIMYAASELTKPFLAYLESEYARDLVERAAWVVAEFGSCSNIDLASFALRHLNDWGGELISEAYPPTDVV